MNSYILLKIVILYNLVKRIMCFKNDKILSAGTSRNKYLSHLSAQSDVGKLH